MEDSFQSILFGIFAVYPKLFLVLLLMRLLVSKHVFVFLFLFLVPVFCLAPGATELVIVPVMFEAGLRSCLELFEATILRSSFVLFQHVRHVATQRHCIRLACQACLFWSTNEDVLFQFVTFHLEAWV
jgi:hypothetical protein